jgi:hypothetical protein
MTVADTLSRGYLPEADPEMETLGNINMFSMLDVMPDRFSDIAHCNRPNMLCAQGLWAGRDLYRATPAVTRDLGFSGLIRRGCRGTLLTQILTGKLIRETSFHC